MNRIAASLALPLVVTAAATGCNLDRDLAMGDLLLQEPGRAEQAVHQVCPAGETTFGVDVSKYQADIDWAAAADDGVKFAIVRVSDGLTYHDEYFDQNWAGTKAAGIIRGTYQFFRSDEDPVAQADLLVDTMGALEPGDLPPVIDVESTDGVGNAARVTKIRQWLDRVEERTGARGIIYTGGYFWQDNVGSDQFASYPLWHAGYTGGNCPSTIADQWSDWTFWQFTSSGRTAGISGNVDQNRFNGSLDQLLDLTVGEAVCGDGRCGAGEGGGACPADCPVCEALPGEGGVVSEAGPCFTGGGPQQYLRHVNDDGEGGNLIWTHTTDDADEANFGEWKILVAEAGRYRLEAYTDGSYAQSVQAQYRVHHAGVDDVFTVNQTSVDGWTVVAADIAFDGAGDELVHVGDNTGEALSGNVQLVFDSLRLVRLDGPVVGEGEGEGEGEGDVGEGEGEGDAGGEGEGERPTRVALLPPDDAEGGCAQTSPSSAVSALVAMAALASVRRRRSR
jgi:GH25 family lysozyme M1 (1,4-beta-N-acetylmuramidase)